MTVFVSREPNQEAVVLLVRAEGSSMLGDLVLDVRPGESALGKSYEQWAALKSDHIEITKLP